MRRPGLPQIIDRLARSIDELSSGDLAELRRLQPDQPSSPTYWRLLLTHLDREQSPSQEQRWARILSLMAHSQGLHTPRRRAGEALAAAVSEARFVRLLRARGARLHSALRQVVHQLSTAAESFDWTDLAALVLSEDTEHGERARRRLARDFYAAQHRASTTSTKESI